MSSDRLDMKAESGASCDFMPRVVGAHGLGLCFPFLCLHSVTSEC